MAELTDAQAWMLAHCSDRWQRPMDMGGRDGSDHSALLAALVRKGLVEREQRGGAGAAYARGSYLYRITPEGEAVRKSSNSLNSQEADRG